MYKWNAEQLELEAERDAVQKGFSETKAEIFMVPLVKKMWIAMDVQDPWISMDIHEHPCISMEINGYPYE